MALLLMIRNHSHLTFYHGLPDRDDEFIFLSLYINSNFPSGRTKFSLRLCRVCTGCDAAVKWLPWVSDCADNLIFLAFNAFICQEMPCYQWQLK